MSKLVFIKIIWRSGILLICLNKKWKKIGGGVDWVISGPLLLTDDKITKMQIYFWQLVWTWRHLVCVWISTPNVLLADALGMTVWPAGGIFLQLYEDINISVLQCKISVTSSLCNCVCRNQTLYRFSPVNPNRELKIIKYNLLAGRASGNSAMCAFSQATVPIQSQPLPHCWQIRKLRIS